MYLLHCSYPTRSESESPDAPRGVSGAVALPLREELVHASHLEAKLTH